MDKTKAYGAGANSYLVKPKNFVDFVQTLALCEGYWRLNHVPQTIESNLGAPGGESHPGSHFGRLGNPPASNRNWH